MSREAQALFGAKADVLFIEVITFVFQWTAWCVKAHVAIWSVVSSLLRMLRHRYIMMHAATDPLREARILSLLGIVETSVIGDQNTKVRNAHPSAVTHTRFGYTRRILV